MRDIVKKCILIFNVLALPFLPLVICIFSPESSILFSISFFFISWFTLVVVGLTMPLQNFLMPQIVATVLICLYLYSMIRDREFHPIRRELPSFLGLSFWTILSAASILCGCLAMRDGVGIPLT